MQRTQLLRLRKGKSTKNERRIGEILKNNRIPFKTKWKIGKYECDFVIGNLVIEVDGNVHKQTYREKDIYLFSQGYVPVHIIGKIKDIKATEKEIIKLIKNN